MWKFQKFTLTHCFSARIHPCDSASSFVIQGTLFCLHFKRSAVCLQIISYAGMMEFVSSEHGIARDLRKHVVFKFFPAMCPDGIFIGNSRCTLVGADLNRSWDTVNEFHHPVLWKVKEYIRETHDVSLKHGYPNLDS